MSWLIAQLKYRSKAVVPAVATILGTALITFLTASGTEQHIVALIPAQYQVLGTFVVGAIITAVVHQIRLGEKPVAASAAAPETDAVANPSTTILTTVTATDSTH